MTRLRRQLREVQTRGSQFASEAERLQARLDQMTASQVTQSDDATE